MSMQELAVMLRCRHQWDFDGCFDECALRILELLEETDGALTC